MCPRLAWQSRYISIYSGLSVIKDGPVTLRDIANSGSVAWHRNCFQWFLTRPHFYLPIITKTLGYINTFIRLKDRRQMK